jgi:RHS repeat-associated protein
MRASQVKWYQAESGLHQNWMRDYDPTTGRYIQADPLGLVDGPSVYNYALQSPGRYIDPRGEACRWQTRRDGNQYMVCDYPEDTYCPSGECSSYGEQHNNPKYSQCMKECNAAVPASAICSGGAGLLKKFGVPAPVTFCLNKVCKSGAKAYNCTAKCIAEGRN